MEIIRMGISIGIHFYKLKAQESPS
jgi:hypothetical protein